MAYKKPIIAEVIALVELAEGSFLPPQFFDLVPTLKERGFDAVEMDSGQRNLALPEGDIAIAVSSGPPRVRCWTQDKTRLVQLSQDMIGANHAVQDGQYLGWDEFRRVFDSAIQSYGSRIGSLRAETLTLNTIDLLNVPASDFVVGRYLSCGGPKVPSWYRECKVNFDISAGLGFTRVDKYNENYTIRGRLRDATFNIHIQSSFQRVANDQDLGRLLEDLHAKSNQHFEDLITDHTRTAVMGGKV